MQEKIFFFRLDEMIGVDEETIMALLEHFHPPLSIRRPWSGFHSGWENTIVFAPNRGGALVGLIVGLLFTFDSAHKIIQLAFPLLGPLI
jgi:hypothetical protein